MLHPSNKRLIDKLAEMTRRKRVDWIQGEEGRIFHDTEGYRVTLTPEPYALLVTDALGKPIESTLPEDYADEQDAHGRPYGMHMAEFYREADRHARGAEKAIDILLRGLDRDGDGIPDDEDGDITVAEEDALDPADEIEDVPSEGIVAAGAVAALQGLAPKVDTGFAPQEAPTGASVADVTAAVASMAEQINETVPVLPSAAPIAVVELTPVAAPVIQPPPMAPPVFQPLRPAPVLEAPVIAAPVIPMPDVSAPQPIDLAYETHDSADALELADLQSEAIELDGPDLVETVLAEVVLPEPVLSPPEIEPPAPVIEAAPVAPVIAEILPAIPSPAPVPPVAFGNGFGANRSVGFGNYGRPPAPTPTPPPVPTPPPPQPPLPEFAAPPSPPPAAPIPAPPPAAPRPISLSGMGASGQFGWQPPAPPNPAPEPVRTVTPEPVAEAIPEPRAETLGESFDFGTPDPRPVTPPLAPPEPAPVARQILETVDAARPEPALRAVPPSPAPPEDQPPPAPRPVRRFNPWN